MKTWIFILSVLGAIGTFLLIKNDRVFEFFGLGYTLLISFTIFIVNLLVGSIVEIFRKVCIPNTIYYNRSSDLVKARIFWSFGIHIMPIILVSFYGIFILGHLNWWQLLLVIVLGSILNFVVDTMDKTEK